MDLCGLRTDAAFRLTVKAVRKRFPRADAVLATGDLSQDGSSSSYRRFSRIMARLRMPVYTLPGNHDKPAVLRKVYRSGRVRAPRVVRIGNWRFLLLDSTISGRNEGRLSAREIKFLENFLHQNRDNPVLMGIHHHPIPVGSRWMDKMVLQNARAFLRVIHSYKNVKAVAFGHVHQAFDRQIRGVRFLGVPASSLQFKPRLATMKVDARAPGYRWIRLYSDGRLRTGVERVSNYRLRPDFRATGY